MLPWKTGPPRTASAWHCCCQLRARLHQNNEHVVLTSGPVLVWCASRHWAGKIFCNLLVSLLLPSWWRHGCTEKAYSATLGSEFYCFEPSLNLEINEWEMDDVAMEEWPMVWPAMMKHITPIWAPIPAQVITNEVQYGSIQSVHWFRNWTAFKALTGYRRATPEY